jgi:hypothetical protein
MSSQLTACNPTEFRILGIEMKLRTIIEDGYTHECSPPDLGPSQQIGKLNSCAAAGQQKRW